jgi:hypothetical protein
MRSKITINRSFIFVGGVLLAAATAAAQGDSYAKVETTPEFTYQHNAPVLGSSGNYNCAGGGANLAYNIDRMWGLATDLSGCHAFGLNNTYGVGSKVDGGQFTYLFGPRLTFRKGRVLPFFDLMFGGDRAEVRCNTGNAGNACGALPAVPTQPIALPPNVVIVVPRNPNATSISQNAFALKVGGGMDIKFNKMFAWRLIQADYLYTRFGTNGSNCPIAYCANNTSQNNFSLNSGLVIGWGGAN